MWCPVCTRQQFAQKQFHKEHGNAAFSVSLDIDPNERQSTVLEHVEENTFGWRYAIAPPSVSGGLASAFGQSMLSPPSTPVVVVCRPDADAAQRLGGDGIKGVDQLRSAVESC